MGRDLRTHDFWTSVDPERIEAADPTPKPLPLPGPPPAPSWSIGLNPDHVRLWITYGLQWLAFVAFALVAGWHLGPRMDEFLVVLTLPLWLVFAPYVVFCLVAAAVKAWIIQAEPAQWRLHGWWLRAVGQHRRPAAPVVSRTERRKRGD